MGWRGTIRALAAAARQAERAQQHRHRELLKQQAQVEKLDAAQRAAHEVAVHENLLDRLTSIHKDCGDSWNWLAIKNHPAPVKPAYSNHMEIVQRQREQRNQPGMFDKVLGRTDMKIKASELAIQQAIEADQRQHAVAQKEYERVLGEWTTLQRVAGGVLAGDQIAFKEAIEELNPFQEISELGRGAQFAFHRHFTEITVALHGQESLPRESKALLKSGKVSHRALSPTAINELYHSHVCSCLLRAAREVFAILPVRYTLVNGSTRLLNSQTGRLENAVIGSVLIARETLGELDFDRLDPVDCMRNFVHRIAFSKAGGFSAVEKLGPDGLRLS